MSRPETKASSYGTEHDGPVARGRRCRRTAGASRIVAARFNDFIVEKLIDGARGGAARARAPSRRATSSSFAARARWRSRAWRARWPTRAASTASSAWARSSAARTPHFDLVVGEAARGIGALTAEGKIAVAFGVLACDTIEQAVERAGAKAGNRGADAAMVAVEMADLYARIEAAKKADAAVPVSVVPAPTTTDLPRRK